MTDEPQKSPVLFAGTKYFDVLMKLVEQGVQQRSVGDYLGWINTLRQVRNLSAPFYNDDNLEQELEALFNDAATTNMKNPVECRRVINETLRFESRLMRNMGPLLLKVGSDNDLELTEQDLERAI